MSVALKKSLKEEMSVNSAKVSDLLTNKKSSQMVYSEQNQEKKLGKNALKPVTTTHTVAVFRIMANLKPVICIRKGSFCVNLINHKI